MQQKIELDNNRYSANSGHFQIFISGHVVTLDLPRNNSTLEMHVSLSTEKIHEAVNGKRSRHLYTGTYINMTSSGLQFVVSLTLVVSHMLEYGSGML